jgi:hypothetical protein
MKLLFSSPLISQGAKGLEICNENGRFQIFAGCLVFLNWVIFVPFHVLCKKDWWLMELQNYKDMTY